MNDESSLRKSGHSTDVYRIFKKRLDKGEISVDRKSLFKESISIPAAPKQEEEPTDT